MEPEEDKRENYKIFIAGEWSLEDLYFFPHNYEQIYFFFHSLMGTHDQEGAEKIFNAFRVFPWQGGYSAVNFYNQLKYITPRRQRPSIKSLKYQSPGWIEVAAVVYVTKEVATIVRNLSESLNSSNKTYSSIMKGLQDRKLMRIKIAKEKIRLEKEQLDYILHCNDVLQKTTQINQLSALQELSGHPFKTLKILLSLYRRLCNIAEYEEKGKADLSKYVESDDLQ